MIFLACKSQLSLYRKRSRSMEYKLIWHRRIQKPFESWPRSRKVLWNRNTITSNIYWWPEKRFDTNTKTFYKTQSIIIRVETFENCKTTVSTAQLCAVVAARRNCEICLAMDWNVLRRTLYLQQKHRQQQHLFVLWATVPASKAFTIMIPSQHCIVVLQQTFFGI